MEGIMPGPATKELEELWRTLRKIGVFTIDQLVSFLGCSVPSARLKLKHWKTVTSYNQNGRYYAMPEVPRFDSNGLWHYQMVSFSKWGNLRNTIVHLIDQSNSGLNGKQIGDLVRLAPRSFLHHFRDVPGIRREKSDGVYVYFSEDAERYNKQLRNRAIRIDDRAVGLSGAEAAVILSALIRQHNISLEDIARLPEIRARKISPAAIREFMERHQLAGKKTPGTKP